MNGGVEGAEEGRVNGGVEGAEEGRVNGGVEGAEEGRGANVRGIGGAQQ